MKSRRWFSGPKLRQWRYMTACGDYDDPFFRFPVVSPLPDAPLWGRYPSGRSPEDFTRAVKVPMNVPVDEQWMTARLMNVAADILFTADIRRKILGE